MDKTDKLLSIDEAAELSGINRKVIVEAIMSGELEYVVFSKQRRVRLSGLNKWWDKNTIKS